VSGVAGGLANEIGPLVLSAMKPRSGLRFATSIESAADGKHFRAMGYSWHRTGTAENNVAHAVDQAIKKLIFELQYPDTRAN
jgi:hypothetical protein